MEYDLKTDKIIERQKTKKLPGEDSDGDDRRRWLSFD